MGAGQVVARIFSYDPAEGREPRYETYEIPRAREMRVLDALIYVVDQLGASLAFRWFCGVRRCGACGVQVNGRPVLACWEPAAEQMVIEPLPNLPIVRDLVVDHSGYDRVVDRLFPYLDRRDPYQSFPEPLTHGAMRIPHDLMQCVQCLICVAACPSWRIDGEGFQGPAALVQAGRFALDPRDALDRSSALARGLYDCCSCYACNDACPMGIDVLGHAVEPLRAACIKRGLGEEARHSHAFLDLIREAGVVTAPSLLLKTRRAGALARAGEGLKLARKGKFSLASPISTAEEIRKVQERMEER
ncbi:MAG: 4Fe-4S dicluster domain-containing protein [Deltaproteobacteria bacterium]|nr:4Fe-4S dicluster domain-containing protein [Deltaproteobacteria bacterium]